MHHRAPRGRRVAARVCRGHTPAVSVGSSGALVTISIGGTDAGCSEVLISCALYRFPCQGWIERAAGFIKNKLPALLDTTYGDIRAKAPTAHVVVLGYPHLFTAEGKTCN